MNSVPLGRTWRMCVIAVTLICFFTTMCLVSPRSGYAFTLSEEKELGKKILEQIREHMSMVEDGEVIAYVQSVGNRIAEQVGATHYQYQFFVVNEPVPNAFAVPGGYIFIYRGLIEMMSTEGELAGILSHEMGHIQARHIQRRMEEGTVLTIATLAGILGAALLGMAGGGGNAASALAIGSMAGSSSLDLKYSRENEREADQLGFRYLCDAGYSPKEMAGVMVKLSKSTVLRGSTVPAYLLTHPALGERIEYLTDMAQQKEGELPKATKSSKTLGDFPFMQAAIFADYCDSSVALEHFKVKDRANGRAPSASEIYGLGRLYLRQGKINEALSYLQEAARQATGSPLVLSSLGSLYLQQGKLDEAQKVLRTALILDPTSSIVQLRLAQVLQELGQRDEALKYLYKIEESAPTFPEIDHHLGVLLGQINEVGLAHYYLGRYYEQKQDWKLTLFHYKQAKELIANSPEKLEEVNRVLKEVEKKNKKSIWESRRSK
ncbi:MAG: M48 family metalloprotease [Syntrophobacteraceae bacterium]